MRCNLASCDAEIIYPGHGRRPLYCCRDHQQRARYAERDREDHPEPLKPRRVYFATSPEDRVRIEAAADRAGLTMAAWIRELVLDTLNLEEV